MSLWSLPGSLHEYVITSYSIHYTKLYEEASVDSRGHLVLTSRDGRGIEMSTGATITTVTTVPITPTGPILSETATITLSESGGQYILDIPTTVETATTIPGFKFTVNGTEDFVPFPSFTNTTNNSFGGGQSYLEAFFYGNTMTGFVDAIANDTAGFRLVFSS